VLREHSVIQCLLSTAATLMQVTSESIDWLIQCYHH